ncbi:hypothetical protein [Brachyspira sp.]|uniref:hypothetical protein n=1 Tax=Brachyspira sp. TaxID=1977261 RepID=UPI00262CD8D9|nr:hypothetical protein [Brachyspira sp.]
MDIAVILQLVHISINNEPIIMALFYFFLHSVLYPNNRIYQNSVFVFFIIIKVQPTHSASSLFLHYIVFISKSYKHSSEISSPCIDRQDNREVPSE